MKANILAVKIRRDAHTITPTTVTEHEIPILQTIFGEESVQTLDGKPLSDDQIPAEVVVGQVDVSETEFDRLAAKYGGNEDGLIVEQVYGKRASRGLDKALTHNAEGAEKKAAAEAKAKEAAEKKAAAEAKAGGNGAGGSGAANT